MINVINVLQHENHYFPCCSWLRFKLLSECFPALRSSKQLAALSDAVAVFASCYLSSGIARSCRLLSAADFVSSGYYGPYGKSNLWRCLHLHLAGGHYIVRDIPSLLNSPVNCSAFICEEACSSSPARARPLEHNCQPDSGQDTSLAFRGDARICHQS